MRTGYSVNSAHPCSTSFIHKLYPGASVSPPLNHGLGAQSPSWHSTAHPRSLGLMLISSGTAALGSSGSQRKLFPPIVRQHRGASGGCQVSVLSLQLPRLQYCTQKVPGSSASARRADQPKAHLGRGSSRELGVNHSCITSDKSPHLSVPQLSYLQNVDYQ